MRPYIIVNGVNMTEKEYKAYVKEIKAKNAPKKTKKAKPKASDVNTKEINEVAMEINNMLKPITTLKSFSAYYDHAYRQWGTIGKQILEHRYIRPHFVFFRVALRELNDLVKEIQKLSKRNEKAAYQYVEKMTWKLDDIKTHLTNVMNGVKKSGYLEAYKNHEAINGNGRRLGLQTLAYKSMDAITQIEKVIKALKEIADNGVDVFNEGAHMSPRTRARCWA